MKAVKPYKYMSNLLSKMGSSDTLTALAIVAHKAEERALLQSNEEALTEEAPPHYLDPLLGKREI